MLRILNRKCPKARIRCSNYYHFILTLIACRRKRKRTINAREKIKQKVHALRTESKEATKLKGNIYVRAAFSNDQKINLQARRRPQQTVKCE